MQHSCILRETYASLPLPSSLASCSPMSDRFASVWDRAGIALSSLCLVHCAVLPLVFLSLPRLATTALAAEGVHYYLAAILLGIGATAFIPGYLRHRRIGILMLGSIGVALIVAGACGERFGYESEGTLITILGSVALITSHWINRSACLVCDSLLCPATPDRAENGCQNGANSEIARRSI